MIFWLFLVALLSTNHKCTHPCLLLLRTESRSEVFWRWCWVLGVRNHQSIVCEDWSLCFQDNLYNSNSLLVVLFFSFSWYCYWLFTYNISICMKLGPDIHIVMHSVLSLKPGVTACYLCLLEHDACELLLLCTRWSDEIGSKLEFRSSSNWTSPEFFAGLLISWFNTTQ